MNPAQGIPFAVQTRHHNKRLWAHGSGTVLASGDRLDDGWLNCTGSLDELLAEVQAGHAWTACHLREHPDSGLPYRSSDSTGESALVALDIDAGWALEAFWDIPFNQRHCLATYTSCSHSEDQHRFRALYQSDRHDNYELHRHLHDIVVENSIGKIQDSCGASLAYMFYGNTSAIIQRNPGAAPLPWDLMDEAQQRAIEAAKPRPRRPSADPDAAWEKAIAIHLLTKVLKETKDEQYHSHWLPAMQAAASFEDDEVWQAFMDWHARGHHAGTQKRVDRRRSRAGRRSGLGKLRKLADEQRPNWFQELPESLRRGSRTPAPLISLAPVVADINGSAPVRTPPLRGPQLSSEPPGTTVARADDGPIDTAPPSATPLISIAPAPESVSVDTLRQTPAWRQKQQNDRAALQDSLNFSGERIHRLMEALYHLRVELIHITDEGEVAVSEDEAEDLIDQYTSELLLIPVFQRNPQRIETRLLEIFRQRHGVERRSSRNLRPEPLFDTSDIQRELLMPHLMAQGCTYILYGTQGVGKTTMALLLGRAAMATPGHNQFLDFPPTPLNEYRQRRILYIASDGDLQAKQDLQGYARRYGLQNQDWLQFDLFRVLAATAQNQAKRWRMGLYELHQLALNLDEAQQEGRPYRLVIIDSLKATTPEGMRVGQQEITDFVELVQSICALRGATVLIVHHEGKEGGSAQGVAGLVEMAHGVFRLKRDENGTTIFSITKTRLDPRGNRDCPYTIDGNGNLCLHASQAPPEDDGRSTLAQLLEVDLARHLESGGSLTTYRGIPAGDLYLALKRHDLNSPALSSNAACEKLARDMAQRGEIQRRPGRHAIYLPRTITREETKSLW